MKGYSHSIKVVAPHMGLKITRLYRNIRTYLSSKTEEKTILVKLTRCEIQERPIRNVKYRWGEILRRYCNLYRNRVLKAVVLSRFIHRCSSLKRWLNPFPIVKAPSS